MRRCWPLTTIVMVEMAQGPLAQPPASPPSPSPPPQTSRSQKPEDIEVVRITTNLVQVDAVVTDKNGKVVTDLKPEEVQILEDDKPQKITHFSYNVIESAPVTPPAKPANFDKNAPPAPPVALKSEQVRRPMAIVVDDLGLSVASPNLVRQPLMKLVKDRT